MNMLVTTTHTIDGHPIKNYCGLVHGEAIVGTNAFRDFFAGIRDIIGGRSSGYERTLSKARQIALDEMTEAATELGANAVVGVAYAYSSVGEGNDMMMVAVTGTAVQV